MPKTPDETKDPQFQNVVQHFLKTPPKPHTPKAKDKASPKRTKQGRKT
jgi:hypothetical protein